MMNTRTISTVVLIAALLSISLIAQGAESLTGRIVGHSCTEQGLICPIDRLDPHIALEADFVLVVNGDEYYFLPNLQRGTKMRYVLDRVTVVGAVNRKYNTIEVDELIVDEGSKQRTVWSKELQLQAANSAWGSPTQ